MNGLTDKATSIESRLKMEEFSLEQPGGGVVEFYVAEKREEEAT